MRLAITVLQIITAILLTGAILIQSRGTGFARSTSYSQSSFTRRGLEKMIFKLTFVLAVLFIIFSVLPLIF